jgi:hypothetical protein
MDTEVGGSYQAEKKQEENKHLKTSMQRKKLLGNTGADKRIILNRIFKNILCHVRVSQKAE